MMIEIKIWNPLRSRFRWECSSLSVLLILCIPSVSMGNSSSSTLFSPIGSNASIECRSNSSSGLDGISWIVVLPDGSTPMDTLDPSAIEALERRGILVVNNITLSTSTLIIPASQMNNRTTAQCRQLNFPHESIFQERMSLIVIGPPLPPALNYYFPSASEVTLEWEEPFTWEGHEVLGYYITEKDRNGMRNFNTTLHNHTHFNPTGEVVNSCIQVTFLISAYSDLGSSKKATIIAGLPRAPGTFGNITPHIRFTSSGEPEVTITIQPPAVCEYQTAEITLDIMAESCDNDVVVTVMEEYSGNPSHILIPIQMDLVANTNYCMSIFVDTIAGNSSINLNFDTVLIPKTSPSLAGITDAPPSTGVLIPVIGGLVGALVVLIVLILIVVLCSCFFVQRNMANTLALERPPIDFPDYSKRDTTYESIDDYQTNPPCSNQYHQQQVLHQRQERPESPYQDMKSANTSSSQQRPFNVFYNDNNTSSQSPHYSSTPHASHIIPNNEMHVTEGGSVVFCTRGSAGSVSTEGDYTAMDSAGTPTAQQELTIFANTSTTLPEKIVPQSGVTMNGMDGGGYKSSHC